MAASASPSIRSVRIWSSASSSLILLMAKPTWIRTQSPLTGKSSSRSPRSTLRRTPTTSIMAAVGWSGKSSTTCPGMAKHMGSLFLSSDYVKRKFHFVFHFQCATSGGGQFQGIVCLQDRKVPEGPQRILSQRHACLNRLRIGNAVHRQLPVESDRILPFAGLGGGQVRALVNDFRIGRSFEHVFLNGALYLATVFVGDVVLHRQRGGLDRKFQRSFLYFFG